MDGIISVSPTGGLRRKKKDSDPEITMMGKVPDEVLARLKGKISAEVEIVVEPLDPGQGFEFKNEITGGSVPKEYIPAIERGIIDTMHKGVWAGFPVVDMRVRLTDGKAHEVDSSELAFRTCASQAFRAAFLRGNPELLEPVMSASITVPEEHAGTITGNLCSRRGRITNMEAQGNAQVVKAMVPLSSMFGYASDLRNASQGRGSFTMHFEHYEAVPFALAEEIIEAKRKQVAARR